MSELTIYFVKVNIAMVFFYLVYRLLFMKDTHFNARRIYLLLTVIFSFIYPFIPIERWLRSKESIQVFISDYALQDILIMPQTSVVFSWQKLLWFSYGMIMLMLIVHMLFQISSIIKLRLSGDRARLNETPIIKLTNQILPFSFFRLIFINPDLHDEKALEEILEHEKAHAHQLHSIDMLLSECLFIVLWINPVSWLIRLEIRQNLEFLADNKVLLAGYNRKTYQYHLLRLSSNISAINFVNNFNISPLKKRITMMNRQKNAKKGLLKYLLVVPIGLALVFASNTQVMMAAAKEKLKQVETKSTNEEGVYLAVEEIPKFPGGEKAMMEFIIDNLKYPLSAFQNNIQGKVLIRFIIDEDGSVIKPEVMRSIDTACDEEALRVVKMMPKWTPGKEKGKAVPVYFVLPITYRLEKNNALEHEQPIDAIDEQASFPGGEQAMKQFIMDNLKYPEQAAEGNVQGRVVLRFLVDKEGNISEIQVVRSLDKACDQEAVRVVKAMPKWKPAKHQGNQVAVYYNLPFTFKIGEEPYKMNPIRIESKDARLVLDDGKRPVLVLDGAILVYDTDINTIDPNKISSINILNPKNEKEKEELISKYGSNAIHGVVIIESKKK